MFGLSQNDKNIALVEAVEANNIDKVRKLLDKGADIDFRHRTELNCHTPLTTAILHGSLTIAKLLLDRGADPDKGVDGVMVSYRSPLQMAVKLNDQPAIKLLLSKGAKTRDILRNLIEDWAYTPAADSVLNCLIKSGCDPDLPDSIGRPPIYLAVKNRHTNAFSSLLPHVRKIDASYDGMTALGLALTENQPEVAKTLLDKGASLDCGKEPATIIALGSCSEALPALFARGADMKMNYHGFTPLHTAAKNGDVKFMQQLIDDGLDINATSTDEKMTPLMMAVIYEEEDAIKALIAAGANTSLKNKHGETARDMAKKKNIAALIPESAQAEYVKIDDWTISRTMRLSALNREITDIFNFKAHERLRLVVNLETKQESHSSDSFDRLPGSKDLEEAIEALRQQGSTADLDVLKSGVLLRPGMRKLA